MEVFLQLTANGIVAAAKYALVALGFNLVYGTTKFINIAHGTVATVGAYAAFALLVWAGWGVIPAAAGAILASGAVGVASDAMIFAPLREKKSSNLVLFIASLGLMIVLQSLLAIIFDSDFQTLSRGIVPPVYSVLGAEITRTQVGMLVADVLILVGFAAMLFRTDFGKKVRAVSDDEEVARVIGIDTRAVIRRLFFIGSCVAGLAGVFIGFDTGIYPAMGLLLIIEAATASIIGGVGNVYGGFVGALLFGLIENYSLWFVGSAWKPTIAFGLIAFFLFLRPKGLFSA